MLLISFLLLLLSCQYDCFYVNNPNGTVDQTVLYNDARLPEAGELRAPQNQIEIFGKTVEVPDWMSNAASKTKEVFGSATEFLGSNSGRKASTNLLTNIKKDQSTRIWLAVYLNIFVIILVYVFITVKLMLLSMKESKQERRKRKTSSSHAAYDSPDYNLPLASIATRPMKPSAPAMCIENPVSDFVEMAREASEEHDDIDQIVPIEMGPSSSTNNHTNDLHIYDNVSENDEIKEDTF